jgi:hypothetical protein
MNGLGGLFMVLIGDAHLQHVAYAFFYNNGMQFLINLHFLLYCYEMMHGLGINYQKSGIFFMGIVYCEKEKLLGHLIANKQISHACENSD